MARQLAYSYLRFSSPAQADGDSVRRQTALRDAWLKRHPEVRLDTTLRMVDTGISGYRGRHRKNKKHALAQFLDLVERGRIPEGSYLVVENLDRLTREEPEESIPLLMNLLRVGIKIVQLSPAEIVFEKGMDLGRRMMMIFNANQGHEESAKKSERLGAAWGHKKQQAREEHTPHGAMCPAWLELVEGAYRIKKAAAEAVRKIFTWSAAGHGAYGILELLHKHNIPPIGTSGAWNRRYVQKILDSVAVLGTYQPMRGHQSHRKEDGEPIPHYYPAIIEEALWAKARQSRRGRQKHRGGRPSGERFPNPFSGLVRDAADGATMHVWGTTGYKYLVSAAALRQESGVPWRSFPLTTFTKAILSQLREIKASDLFSDPAADRVTVLQEKLAALEKRIAVATTKFDADPENPIWAAKISEYGAEKRSLLAELKEAELEASNPRSATWGEAVALMEVATTEPLRLQAALRECVEGIDVLIVARGRLRLCECQIKFTGGARRDYTIIHQGAVSGAAVGARGTRPARWCVFSFLVEEPTQYQDGEQISLFDRGDLTDPYTYAREEHKLREMTREDIDRWLEERGSTL
jgi:DNA invertase Pin-like site-specific DNA recombinase